MTAATLGTRAGPARHVPNLRHDLQLALAGAAAFLVSPAFRLPENFWAAMPALIALIVVRPSTGSTPAVGRDRVRPLEERSDGRDALAHLETP